jgi:hypothetical protein
VHTLGERERERNKKTLVGKHEGKRQFRRPRCKREDNIKNDVKKKGCGCVDWLRNGFNSRFI